MSQTIQVLLAPTLHSTYHGWKPHSNKAHDIFVGKIFTETEKINSKKKNPADVFFDSLTLEEKDLFEEALLQVDTYYSQKWADPRSIAADLEGLKQLFRGIVVSAPKFYKANIDGVTIGEPIGVPIYLILDLISNTTAAYTLFTQPSFNAKLKILLNGWKDFLETYDSTNTLTDHEGDPVGDGKAADNVGWFSSLGLQVLNAALGPLDFFTTYETERPELPYYNSWNSFFTRALKPGVRPIDRPKASGAFYLHSPCESTVLRTAKNVQHHDLFWGKTQNYSLYDILGRRGPRSLAPSYAERLVGSLAIQAFLGPADYHRWHSPLRGVIAEEPVVIPGTYYAVLPDDGAPEGDSCLVPGDPHGAIIRSQPWLSAVATRAVFIIKPPANPLPTDAPFELAALVQIGMVEVSSCVPMVRKGDKVEIGDLLGEFRFGGSSYLLLVKPKPGYDLIFRDVHQNPVRPGQHRWVNSVIGQFRSASPVRQYHM